ncbi:MAG: DNA alkylation repair protein, partial [bacterium]|nr:DNA alkylation repair protein [bacterium]
MNFKEVMAELKRMGTAQNRKVYARHGYSDNMFGVSFAHLRQLGKRIRRDHALAQQLWATGNEDARHLACMIADPEAMTSTDLDAWISDIGHYCLADVFSKEVASRSPHAAKKISTWTRSKSDFTGQAGWDVVALLALDAAETPEATFEKHVATIEKKIHKASNRT